MEFFGAMGSWRRKRWSEMTLAEKSHLTSAILVAYTGEKTAEKAATYFGVSVMNVRRALRMLARQGEITLGKKTPTERYIPLLARYNDRDVQRLSTGRRVPWRIVNAKRA